MKTYKERSRREPHRNVSSQRVVIPWNALPVKVVSSKTTRLFNIEYDKCGEGLGGGGGGVKISYPFYLD